MNGWPQGLLGLGAYGDAPRRQGFRVLGQTVYCRLWRGSHRARMPRRSFSGREPVEEFAMETRAAYTRMLGAFRREALATLFRGNRAWPTRPGVMTE